MKNDFTMALDEPVGMCTQNKGMNDCSKWPDRYPSPCCWLSCSELCGAACYRPFVGHGQNCPDYGGERNDGTGISEHSRYGEKRVVGI